MLETILIVPCYNEARRFQPPLFIDFVDRHPDCGFLLVNDGSRDQTRDLLQQVAAARPKSCFALSLERNQGKAEAVRQGMLAAREHKPAFAGFWDADLATPLDTVPEFIALLKQRPELRLVMGSRVRLLGRQVERRASRHYVGRCLATIISLILGLPVYDTQCGAKLFRCDHAWEQAFAEPFISRWLFDVEILARYQQAARKALLPPLERCIYESPLQTWHEIGQSHLGLKDGPRVLLALARIWWTY
ncbi:MAG: glycosyltransferase [Planctomycetota bacterium]|nr:glycosyltransferase [Planctomycetota bacterium]